MTPERWAQIEELFHRAAECPRQQRSELLDSACNGDAGLRREVEALLASEASASEDMQAAVSDGVDALAFPLVGETVSHYRILRGLGGGGMGLVYSAEDIKLGRKVALKFLPEESIKDPAALGRFEREARSASALEHLNICPIYEFGEHEGQPFLVMQLLEGQTLREWIAGSELGKLPFDLPRLLDLASQIAEGLDVAHRHGIIHRDIKPANIFITAQGQAKILDFGLAKLSHGDSGVGEPPASDGATERDVARVSPPLATPDPLLSRTGVAMGTAAYMSPEQARGEKLDSRTDLFSFGLVLYEMATGQRAFHGNSGPILHRAILQQTPTPVRQLNAKLPAKLEAIVRKALAKDRSERYQSAAEIRVELQSLSKTIEPRSLISSWPAAILLIVSLLSVPAILWVISHPKSEAVLPEIKFRQLTINSTENPVTSNAISPSGKYLAYTDSQGVHVRDLENGEVSAISVPAEAVSKNVQWEIIELGWFPDDLRFVANSHPTGESTDSWTSRTSEVWVFSRTNEYPPRKLRDHALAWSVSPDGSQIAFGTNIDLLGKRPSWLAAMERETWLMQSDGSEARKLLEADLNSSIGGLIWSRDGKRALYIRTDASGDTILNLNLRDGFSVPVLSPPDSRFVRGDFSWLPDGRLIYQVGQPETEFSSAQEACNFWSLRLDPDTGKPVEKPKQFTNWTGFCMSAANVTADGKRLAFMRATTFGTIYVADLEASGTRLRNLRHFTQDESLSFVQDWTHDSRSVVFTSNRAGQNGVYRQAIDEDRPQLIAISNLRDTPLSPDGKWLFGIRWPKAEPKDLEQIFRIPISGGAPQLLATTKNAIIFCAKPPSALCVLGERTDDLQSLVFSSIDPLAGRGRELARFPVDLNAGITDFDISPDGSSIAVSANTVGPIHLLSLRGQPERIIPKTFENFQEYHWAADGKGLYVPDLTSKGVLLYYVNLHGNSHVLWDSHSRGFAWARASPDGRHLAIASITNSNNVWMMENF